MSQSTPTSKDSGCSDCHTSMRYARASSEGAKLLQNIGWITCLTAGTMIGYFFNKYYNKTDVKISKGYRGKLQSSVRDYIDREGNRYVQHYSDICNETRELFGKTMEGWTVAIDQCYFLQWLMPSLKIKKAIEVGVFTGCSSLAIALGIPEDGTLLAFDIKEGKKYTDVAQKYWKKAGVDKKVTLDLNGGLDGLDRLLEDDSNLNSFDFAFVDAAKNEYVSYYERLIKLIKVGGYLAFDNTVYEGKVADRIVYTDKLTEGVRAFNKCVNNDKRVEIAMVYCGDGTTFIRKVSN